MIRTEPVDSCFLCGRVGTPRYTGLRDHVFGAPGSWNARACDDCELLWLDPRPASEDIARVYATYYTHVGATRGGAVFEQHFPGWLGRVRNGVSMRWQRARKGIARRELGYFPIAEGRRVGAMERALRRVPVLRDSVTLQYADLPMRRGGRLLDVGCGNGTFLLAMREQGWSVTGLETDGVAAAYARREHALEVHEGTLGEVALPAASFDAIVLSHVIEHVYDPIGVLRECARLLAPGGTVVVITPNAESLGHRMLGRAWRGLEPPRHLHVFGPGALAACARKAGLRVAGMRTSARLMNRIWYVSRGIARAERHGVPRNTRTDYIQSFAMTALEDVCRLLRPQWGEEIVMAATTAEREEGV